MRIQHRQRRPKPLLYKRLHQLVRPPTSERSENTAPTVTDLRNVTIKCEEQYRRLAH
jgi:hypothetical protein